MMSHTMGHTLWVTPFIKTHLLLAEWCWIAEWWFGAVR